MALVFLLIAGINAAYAQPTGLDPCILDPDGPGCDGGIGDPDDVPLDGGLGILIVAGALYGLKKLKDKKYHRKQSF